MTPAAQYPTARTTAILIVTAIIVSIGSAQAQGISDVYVLQDNGYAETGGTDFPQDPFPLGVVRGVDVAWVVVNRFPREIPFSVTSSHPNVFSVEGSPLTTFALATVTEPSAPTQVTLRANTIPPTSEKSTMVTVYPSQRVDQVRLVPERPFYVPGEDVEVEVTMRYAEPFPASGSHSLALRFEFEPRIQDVAYVQYSRSFGSDFGIRPFRVDLQGEKVFRVPMRLLLPAKQTLKVSVMCAVTEFDHYSNPFDDCHTGTRTASFEVINGPRLRRIVLNNPMIAGGASTSGRLEVSALDPAAPAQIALFSSDPSVSVPATVTLTGSGLASASFPITTTMAPGSREVTITAQYGRQETRAVMTVEGVLVRDLAVAKPELRSEESFDLVVTLDRPAPGPVTVTLTSSDPRAAPLPTQVTFRKGEQTKTVAVRTGTATLTTNVRLSGSIAGTPTRETAIRIVAADGAAPRSTSRDR